MAKRMCRIQFTACAARKNKKMWKKACNFLDAVVYYLSLDKKWIRRCGEIGRRNGLKIRRGQLRAGSTPASGTTSEWTALHSDFYCKKISHTLRHSSFVSALASVGTGRLPPASSAPQNKGRFAGTLLRLRRKYFLWFDFYSFPIPSFPSALPSFKNIVGF